MLQNETDLDELCALWHPQVLRPQPVSQGSRHSIRQPLRYQQPEVPGIVSPRLPIFASNAVEQELVILDMPKIQVKELG